MRIMDENDLTAPAASPIRANTKRRCWNVFAAESRNTPSPMVIDATMMKCKNGKNGDVYFLVPALKRNPNRLTGVFYMLSTQKQRLMP